MLTFLLLGFLLGLRHAVEADHVAAVATLVARAPSARQCVLRGAVWGLGHTLTLLVVGGTSLVAGLVIPDHIHRLLEGAVGVMLVALGLDVFRRMRQGRIHFHPHEHGELRHIHAHRHVNAAHDHLHARRFPLRALLVGSVHGVAGSAALVLLAAQAASGPVSGLGYILLFGCGSIAGMAVLSLGFALPLRVFGGRVANRDRLVNRLSGVGAIASIALGVWMMIETGLAAS